MRTPLLLTLLCAGLVTGCASDSTAPSSQPEPPPAGAVMQLTEPWKSLNLPIDGAVIDFSTETGLGLTFVTHTQSTAPGIVGNVITSLESQGYTKGNDKDLASMRVVELEHPESGTIALTLNKRDERPSLKLTKR